MLSFHIDPKSMEPRVCEFAEGRCPLEASVAHIRESDIQEHFQIYEMTMSDFELVSFSRKGAEVSRRYDIKEAFARRNFSGKS